MYVRVIARQSSDIFGDTRVYTTTNFLSSTSALNKCSVQFLLAHFIVTTAICNYSAKWQIANIREDDIKRQNLISQLLPVSTNNIPLVSGTST